LAHTKFGCAPDSIFCYNACLACHRPR